MRKTLELPDKILQKAMEITDSQDENEVVVNALKEIIRKNKISRIKEYKGKVDLDVDLDELRDRNGSFSR